MFDQPQLLIIAGPNGAGKSTLSRDLAPEGAFVFDPDQERAKIEAKFPDLPAESIDYALNQCFFDCIHDVLADREDFVLETNFRDSSLMDTVSRFKEQGYAVNMIYMVLSGLSQSIDRVSFRVKNGGHFVDNESIRTNYIEGLKNLNYFADRFDNLEIVDSSTYLSKLRTLLSVQQRHIIFLESNLPKWIKNEITAIAGQFNESTLRQQNKKQLRRFRGPRL
jgi:predicted ABC-type ATPase